MAKPKRQPLDEEEPPAGMEAFEKHMGDLDLSTLPKLDSEAEERRAAASAYTADILKRSRERVEELDRQAERWRLRRQRQGLDDSPGEPSSQPCDMCGEHIRHTTRVCEATLRSRLQRLPPLPEQLAAMAHVEALRRDGTLSARTGLPPSDAPAAQRGGDHKEGGGVGR